jgi:hypothetical protein
MIRNRVVQCGAATRSSAQLLPDHFTLIEADDELVLIGVIRNNSAA